MGEGIGLKNQSFGDGKLRQRGTPGPAELAPEKEPAVVNKEEV